MRSGHVSVTHVASVIRQRCGFLQLVDEASSPHGEAVGSMYSATQQGCAAKAAPNMKL